MGTGLFAGFPGVAWVLEHLQNRFLEDGEEDPGEEIAGAVHRVLGLSPWEREHDLMSGLAGLGIYALERLPRPWAEESLRLAVRRLAETAERVEDGGTAWRTPGERVPEDRRDLFPDGYFAVGVAHGLAGIAGFLASALEAGIGEARPLLDGTVSWLLRHRLPPESGAVFSYEIAPGVEPRPSLPGWCWGDPGTLAVLMGAARRAGEPAWEREVVAMARDAAVRSLGGDNVRDASLCHGSAGLGHLFNRLFQATGEPDLAEAALHWFGRTLELRRPGEGVGGFLAWENDDQLKLGWCAEPGFLTGAAGVGLALLAAATPVAPDWDRILLLSIPPKR
jgi:lantibiotic modifying enzyme